MSDLSSDDYDYETDAEGEAIAMIPEYSLEDEQEQGAARPNVNNHDLNEDPWGFGSDVEDPYADDPIADEEWMENYRRERQVELRRNEELENRLNGTSEVNSWYVCDMIILYLNCLFTLFVTY